MPPRSADKPRRLMTSMLLIFGAVTLFSADSGAVDPMRLLLVPLGNPVPDFILPGIDDETPGLSSADLKGGVSIVNVFASWCLPCREEHPLLMALADRGDVPIYGLNYKDAPESARRWLLKFGNPYAGIGSDRDGRVAAAWDLFALPQTIVVDNSGRTAFVHAGVLDQSVIQETILPLVSNLKKRAVTP